MAGCFRLTQYLVAGMLLCALGLIVTAAAVDYWWVRKAFGHNVEAGLWRACRSNSVISACVKRKDLFQYSANKHFDIVLTALCVSGACYFASFALIMVTICQRFPVKCLILTEVLVTFNGVAACGFGITWALIKIEKGALETGWAFYALYSGGGLSVLALLSSVILLCMGRQGTYISTKRDDEMIMLRS